MTKKKGIEQIDDLHSKAESESKNNSNFAALVKSLKDLDPKKKLLWIEIYDNAVSDRERAAMLFTEAYQSMGNSSADHVALGSIMAKYIERMSKSNDQILNLADMVSKAMEREEQMDPDALFRKIQE
jgi:Tfp pilus assembly protein PilF